MHKAGPGFDQAVFLAGGQVDGMAVNRTFAQKPLGFVGVEIVARLRKQLFHPSDFIDLL